jgi:3-hydroxyisobutyrate dehydrogenase-like beta-hydroxyacid dehydrogenase
MTVIGVVGLGAMGGRIAGRLLSQGHNVYGTNRTRARADALIEQGLLWTQSPRKVAETAEFVFSIVSDDRALEAVTGGAAGILAGLGPGKVYVDMSTVSPQTSLELAERVASRGASMLAAPVFGSVDAADDGSLAIIVGGDKSAFARVEPTLRLIGSTVTLVEDHGQALRLKLAINVNLAGRALAFSEGLRLAERAGIARDVALDVLARSAIGSARHGAPLQLPDRTWFDVHELFSAARLLGYEHRDIAALFHAFAEMVTPSAGRASLGL